MLTEFLAKFCAWMVQLLCELAMCLVVDIATRSYLRDARTADEKRTVWFYEFLALAVCCIIVWFHFHHFPCGFALAAVLTLVLTQFPTASVRRHCLDGWRMLKTFWEEFEFFASVEQSRRQLVDASSLCGDPADPTPSHLARLFYWLTSWLLRACAVFRACLQRFGIWASAVPPSSPGDDSLGLIGGNCTTDEGIDATGFASAADPLEPPDAGVDSDGRSDIPPTGFPGSMGFTTGFPASSTLTTPQMEATMRRQPLRPLQSSNNAVPNANYQPYARSTDSQQSYFSHSVQGRSSSVSVPGGFPLSYVPGPQDFQPGGQQTIGQPAQFDAAGPYATRVARMAPPLEPVLVPRQGLLGSQRGAQSSSLGGQQGARWTQGVVQAVPTRMSQSGPVTSPSRSLLGTVRLYMFGGGAESGVEGAGARWKPRGLPNDGHNLCFLNAALQLMAHTGGLRESMERDLQLVNHSSGAAPSSPKTLEARAFTITLLQLLTDLSSSPPPSGLFRSSPAPPDTTELRAAAARLQPDGLIVDSREDEWARRGSGHRQGGSTGGREGRQAQQDASELLAWLLDVAHTALNRTGAQALSNGSARLGAGGAPTRAGLVNGSAAEAQRGELLAYETRERAARQLAALRQAYGPQHGSLRDQRAALLELVTRFAHNETRDLVGALVRLSDIDWLLHCADNNSPLDDFFAGQFIDVHKCCDCDRLTVNTQPFRVLSVTLADTPGQTCRLDNCLRRFRVVETLTGFRCEHCSKVAAAAIVTTPLATGIHRRVNSTRGTSVTPSASLNHIAVSPIPSGGNDVASFDRRGAFSTSTPIAAPSSVATVECQRTCALRFRSHCIALQLMRFRVDSAGRAYKVHTPVDFPARCLDVDCVTLECVMEEAAQRRTRNSYDLYAFCVHLGAECVSGGHYVAYALDGGVWWRFDDEKVERVDVRYELERREVRENVYLLLYRLVV